MKYTLIISFWGLLFLSSCFGCTSCSQRERRSSSEVATTEVAAESVEEVASSSPMDDSTPFSAPKVNLYIENSSSMNGYFNEKQGVKDLRLSLFNLAQRVNCSSLSFINSKVIPTNGDAQSVLKDMSMADFRNYGQKGDVTVSDLSSILKTVADNTQTSGQITLLVSDFLFCPSKDKAETSLGPDAEKGSITSVFKDRNLSVVIFKLEGDFAGQFYTGHFERQNNVVTEISYQIKKQKRPYYIWAIGGEREIGWLMKEVDLSNVGIQNSLCLTMGGKSVEYHLVPRKGVYDVDRRDNKHAVSATMGRNGFTLVFDAQLQGLPLSEDYLCDVANYTTSDDNYMVESVKNIDGRYRITIRGTKVKAGKLTVSLKMCIPQWVDSCSLPDNEWDIRISGNENRTFGFKALVGGVLDAMTSPACNNAFVMFNLKIN